MKTPSGSRPFTGWTALVRHSDLVQLLPVFGLLQEPAVLAFSVLAADERGALLRRGAAVELLVQGKMSGPETVCVLVPHLQEELMREATPEISVNGFIYTHFIK